MFEVVDDAFELFSEVVGYARHRPPAQVGRKRALPMRFGSQIQAVSSGKETSLADRSGLVLYAKHRGICPITTPTDPSHARGSE